MKHSRKELLLIILAFAIIYVVWGTTFVGVKYAITSIPPILMAGSRYGLAGLILLIITSFIYRKVPSAIQLRNAAIAGIMFVACGTGAVAWSLQYVDAGVTSLIIAGQPLITLLMVWWMLKQPPILSSYIGVVLGILGMFILVRQDHVSNVEGSLPGILLILFGMLCWGYGSVFIKKADFPPNQSQNTSLQMIFGGAFLIPVGLLIGEGEVFEWQAITATSYWAMAYLILFGSILGFSSFNYLLKRVSPEKVSTSTYVNPIVAMILGAVMLGEKITPQSILAAMTMLLGVLFINMDMISFLKKRLQKRKLAAQAKS